MMKEADVDWKTVVLGRSVKEKEGVEAEFLKVLEDGASRISTSMLFHLHFYQLCIASNSSSSSQ